MALGWNYTLAIMGMPALFQTLFLFIMATYFARYQRSFQSRHTNIDEKNSSQSEEDYMETKKDEESILKKNSDWIWDWSSRPENITPHPQCLFKPPQRTTALSWRNTSVREKGGIVSAVSKVFLPSLLVSHLLAMGLGIYI
eukprot:bmy_20609T0